jgi:50S ribosomal subunit-associated GTPase HflX
MPVERTKRERSRLVGVIGHPADEQTEASLDELSPLIDTVEVPTKGPLFTQRRDAPDNSWFIGRARWTNFA